MKISKKDFAQVYKYIKKHCYWLSSEGTLKQADWNNVLRDFKKVHRQGNIIPVPVWSLCNLITLALQPLQTPPPSETKSYKKEHEKELLEDMTKLSAQSSLHSTFDSSSSSYSEADDEGPILSSHCKTPTAPVLVASAFAAGILKA